jgi:hypothetical protein
MSRSPRETPKGRKALLAAGVAFAAVALGAVTLSPGTAGTTPTSSISIGNAFVIEGDGTGAFTTSHVELEVVLDAPSTPRSGWTPRSSRAA